MNAAEILQELESLGTEQNRKIYRRHGAGEKLYGVSYANLGALKKKLNVDHDLAEELWKSGNDDAQILATMIADPARLDAKSANRWGKDVRSFPVIDALAALVARTTSALSTAEKWIDGTSEWIERAGWQILAHLAQKDRSVGEERLEGYLKRIERDIHDSKNRVKQSMNGTLIAIGLRSEQLEAKAITAATAIGKVEVDHGDTSCKTPDAVAYIRKAKSRI